MRINVSDIKYPTTPEEVQANRRKVIKGLRRYKNQCFGDLYREIAGQHARCAVGVCAAVLFGIKTEKDYLAVLRQDRNFDIYSAVARMLGIATEFSRPTGYEGVSVSDIWKMNDRGELSFAQIAAALAGKWDLA